MPLAAGSRFGNFDLVALLGVGGMGAVYRARDRKLNRVVALKLLPEEFARDADRCARFEREAQVLASLSHPNIAVIHGVEDASDGDAPDGVPRRALVLELVEGATLADELEQGALPFDRALHIARQIAEALEVAHERGVVHRDLKPANVKVRPDGIVKVLDFGLAKALDAVPPSASGQPPTLVSPALTVAGMIFGTAAYMSPEQARGKPADKRSDVWAFGCVLYEMLTGKRAFPGDEVSDTMAAILRAEPDWSALPADVPAAVRRVLRRSLEKDRARRLRDIGDARLELEAGAADETPAGHRSGAASRTAWNVATVLAAVAGFAVARWNADERPAPPEYRLDVTTPETSTPASFAVSPDGRSIVYTADGPRGEQLWVRELESSVARPLPGTENARLPFWSPDSRSIAFFSLNALQRIGADGGRAETLASAVVPAGGTWRDDGTIFYVPSDSSGVWRVPAGGNSESARVTADAESPVPNRLPQALPDGRHFLVFIAAEDARSGVYVADENGAMRRILAADTAAVYGAGYLWFVQQGTLFAQRFDSATQQLVGPVLRIADDVGADGAFPAVSVSGRGAIAYRAGTRHLQRQLVWFDRAGARLSTVGDPDSLIGSPSLSPDEKQLLVQRTVQHNVDIWSFDLERNVPTRLTSGLTVDSMPIWGPDGSRFVFNSLRADRTFGIQHADGTEAEQGIIPPVDTIRIATDWSRDGLYLLGKQVPLVGGPAWDLLAFPLRDGASVQQLTAMPYDERDAQFSPDGEWIAFESNETGTPEIYIQPFGRAGAKRPVSIGGGRQVRWRRDGAELFYVSLDGTLMAVPMAAANGDWTIGKPTPLFDLRLPPTTGISRQSYVVSHDGQRFLATTAGDVTPPITLLLNWQPPAE